MYCNSFSNVAVYDCFVQSLDMQMKMLSDNMQDKKQKGRAADSDESFQGI